MRRRHQAHDDGVPRQLRTFDAVDWPEGELADSFSLWREARRMWRERYGWPHQDPLEFLQDERRQRLAAEGIPDPNAVPTRPDPDTRAVDDDTAAYFDARFREWTAMPTREEEG